MMSAGAVSLRPESFVIPAIAKLLLASDGDLRVASEAAPYSGHGARVVEVMRALVDAGSTSGGDWSAIAPYKFVAGAFIESLRNQSAFAALAPSFQPMPLRSNIIIVSTTGVPHAHIVDEGAVKPISSMSLQAPTNLDALKAIAIVVVSNEVAKFGGELGERLIRNELRNAVSLTVDLKFFDILTAMGAGWVTVVPASGTTVDAMAADVRAALLAIDTDASSRLFWVAASGTAKALAALVEGGHFVNGDLGPTGGTFAGSPLVVSDALGPDELWLIDAAKIGGSFENLMFSSAKSASVEMSDAPTDPVDATAVMLSLWQHNLVGIKAEIFFGAKPLRENFAAQITGVDYGAPA